MSHESQELVLYATNDSTLYNQRAKAIIKALAKKMAAGKYDAALAVKAWRHWADAAARRYGKEFASSEREGLAMFSTADRNAAAREARDYYDEEVRVAAAKLSGTRKNPAGKRRNGSFPRGAFITSHGGKKKAVKNLGWLLANWKRVESFRLYEDGLDGYMEAKLRDGSEYSTDWASFELMLRWLMRPVFMGVDAVIVYAPDYMANEYTMTIGSPKYKKLLDEKEAELAKAAKR